MAEITLLQGFAESLPVNHQPKPIESIDEAESTIKKLITEKLPSEEEQKNDDSSLFDRLSAMLKEITVYKSPIRAALKSFDRIAQEKPEEFTNLIQFIHLFSESIRGCDSWSAGASLQANPSLISTSIEATWYYKLASIDIELLIDILSGDHFRKSLFSEYSKSNSFEGIRQSLLLNKTTKDSKSDLIQKVIFISQLIDLHKTAKAEESNLRPPQSLNQLLFDNP
jgi:hypothetical protein